MKKLNRNRERQHKLEILLKLTEQINSDISMNSVLFNIIEGVKEIAECEASSVFLVDHTKNELVLAIPSGPAGKLVEGKRIALHDGIAGWTAKYAESLLVNDVTKDPRFHGDFDQAVFTTRNILSLPLQNKKGDVIGVVQAVNKIEENGFSEDDIPILKALASQAAFTIANSQLLKERDTLLSEVHHRVKNNMAIISGMMQIEAMAENNVTLRNKLLINIIRITAMAAVHEQMYKESGFSNLNFSENLSKIVDAAISTTGADVAPDVTIMSRRVLININQALPLAMIISELIFHILTIGSELKELTISTELKDDEARGEVTLTVSDNGNPVVEYVKSDKNSIQGLNLIDLMVQQLEGESSYVSKEGVNQFKLTFKKSDAGGSGNKFL